jgi:hypothetical protein
MEYVRNIESGDHIVMGAEVDPTVPQTIAARAFSESGQPSNPAYVVVPPDRTLAVSPAVLGQSAEMVSARMVGEKLKLVAYVPGGHPGDNRRLRIQVSGPKGDAFYERRATKPYLKVTIPIQWRSLGPRDAYAIDVCIRPSSCRVTTYQIIEVEREGSTPTIEGKKGHWEAEKVTWVSRHGDY